MWIKAAFLTLAISLVASCESSEERAEARFQSGMALLEEGDRERALIEFRNVFQLNGQHREAREVYARTLREMDQPREAFSQYLRLVEQFPDDLAGRLALAEMAIDSRDWEAARRHGEVAVELAGDDNSQVAIVEKALDYQQAVEAEDAGARREVHGAAVAQLEQQPDSRVLRSIAIDGYLRDGDDDGALDEIDAAIALNPGDLRNYQSKIAILAQREDEEALETELVALVERFPENEAVTQTLIQYYVSRDRLAEVEDILRGQITEGEPDDAARSGLIQFIVRTRGPEAALEAVDGFIEEGTNDLLFRSMRATLRFDMGNQDEAIAELQEVIENAERDPETRQIEVGLAQLLIAEGNEVGARRIVDRILEEDASMTGALKLRAQWLIADDKADEAINVLRTALDQAPEDHEIMLLMASAYERNGSHDLTGELLSLAVETSNRSPETSMTYARYLINDDNLLLAEDVLVTALRLRPGNLPVLQMLGDVYVQMQDWPRAAQVEATLRSLEDDAGSPDGADGEVERIANALKFKIIAGQEGQQDAVAFLEDLAAEGSGETAADIAVIRAHLVRGDFGAARDYLGQMREKAGDTRQVQFLSAAVDAAAGDLDAAEAQYRALLADDDDNPRLWLELIRLLSADGRPEDARVMLDRALDVTRAPDLLWAKASALEADGDVEGAIEIYEELYKSNSANSIVANNLASLLSNYRENPEALERAYAIARRLRGSEIPPYADTYGWISYLRGDYEVAVEHLEVAAAGLASDPVVQYHLGKAYAAIGRSEDAIDRLTRTIEMSGDRNAPQVADAKAEIEKLETVPAE